MQKGSPEATALAPELADLAAFRDSSAIHEAGETVDQVNRILSRPEFVDISKAFDKCTRNPERYDKAWHVPLGKKTLGALIGDLGRSAEYTVFYAAGSEATHCSNYARHVHFGAGIVTFEAIRQLPGFESLFRFSVAHAIHCYRMILAEYRSGELAGGAFRRKYEENWRGAFMNVPKVQYQVQRTVPAKDH